MNEDQYHRQMLFEPIGSDGQERLAGSTVFVAGCGALGSTIAGHLVRCGVGRLIICDRDRVELSNLPRQCLFEYEDAVQGLPKVEAARRRLGRVNPAVSVEPIFEDLDRTNIEKFVGRADCVADGSDNFELRLLLNDAALKHRVPWVYTGVIAGEGQNLTIPEGGRPCLRCYVHTLPAPGTVATCATLGVLGPAVGLMGSLAAAEVVRILAGHPPANVGRITVADIWNNTFRRVTLDRDPACPACGAGEYEFLNGRENRR